MATSARARTLPAVLLLIGALSACDDHGAEPTISSPTIDSVTPAVDTAGARVTIHGSGFDIDSIQVFFGNTAADSAEPLDARRISAVVPGTLEPGAYTLGVINRDGDTASLESGFELVLPPHWCANEGTCHSGAVSGTWWAADGPHHLVGAVDVTSQLTIEAGTVVIGGRNAQLRLMEGAHLVALGSVSAPIAFIAADSAEPWGGIVDASSDKRSRVTLRNARIEHATAGVAAGSIDIDHSLIRKIGGAGVRVEGGSADGRGRIRHSAIEEACQSGAASAAVVQESYATMDLEEVVIRDSGCAGVYVDRRTTLRVVGVRVLGSAGTGLWLSDAAGGDPDLTEVSSLRITGGRGYPAELPGGAARTVLETVPLDSLLGNAADTLVVSGGFGASVQIDPRLPWLLSAPDMFYWGGTVTLGPGSHLGIGNAGGVIFGSDARLIAEGTPQAPAVLAGPGNVFFEGSRSDSSRLAHARLYDVSVTTRETHPLRITSSEVQGGFISLLSPRSSIHGSLITDGGRAGVGGAVVLGGSTALEGTTIQRSVDHGLEVRGADVRISNCAVTGSAGDGVHVANTGVGLEIRQCNIVDNEGYGVNSEADSPVDATLNWWGDPDGPTGPDGDGARGNVAVEPWLTAPASTSTSGYP